MREPFGVIDNGGNGGGCGHQSTLPIGPADGKHARGSFWSAHARGLKRFCSGQGSAAQAYGYIPRLADAAMDKIGQIPQDRKTTRLNSSHQCASRMPSSACQPDNQSKPLNCKQHVPAITT